MSTDDSGSPALHEAIDPMSLGVVTAGGRQLFPLRSTFQVQIEDLNVPIVAASKNLKLLGRDGDQLQAASSVCSPMTLSAVVACQEDLTRTKM